MAYVLILTGGGDWNDPWHPFLETSGRLAELLAGEGHDVLVKSRFDAATLGLLDGHGIELVVVNAGNAEQPSPDDAPLLAALQAFHDAGRPLLVMHVTATAFPELDGWERLLGGRWVRGATMHPDWAESSVHVETDSHPVVAGVDDFTVRDELYSYLRTSAAVRGLAWHEYEGLRHPLVWALDGPGRVVYDALGHDAESYDAAEHPHLLANAVTWLLG
jgi:type 1 glutamine amidotransferase